MDQTKILTYGMTEVKENKISSNQDLIKHKNDLLSAKSEKRRRRGKKECEGRDFVCIECGKAYLSAPALMQHRKTKHNFNDNSGEKRGRGRPKKIVQNPILQQEKLIENTELVFKNFFDFAKRKKRDILSCLILKDFVDIVFSEIYQKYNNYLPINYQKASDNGLLKMAKDNNPITDEVGKEKTCDICFYEYLKMISELANQEYFLFAFKFIVLFRECINKYKGKELEKGEIYTEVRNPDSVPDLCNEFICDFMEQANYFGMDSNECKNEFIEIIQHFCCWLYDKGYTNSRLTLMPPDY